MRVLLTGVTGFVGKAIELHLHSRGHEVFGVHANQNKTETSHGIGKIITDIGSNKAVEKLLEIIPPCQVVIHAAASMRMDLFANDLIHTNCAGVQNMLWLSKQLQAQRFVFLSSVPVIGIPKQLPITETHTTEPLTAYHSSKLFGEQLVRLAEKQSINGICLRLTAPVGPRMPRSRLLPMLVSRALVQLPLELSGTGSRKQNYVDVRDVAKACELSFASDVAGVVNIAGSDCISNFDLARRCIKLSESKSEIVMNGQVDTEEGLEWDVSIEKASQTLGYFPQFNVDDTIASLIAEMACDKQYIK